MGERVSDRASRFQRWQHRLSDTPASLEADARAGFDTERFYLLYQPRMTCADGEIRVVEALLRWQDSTRGDMHPGVFLPSLAETAVMGELGRWVLDRACAQASEWDRGRPAHEPAVAMAVNVTLSELLQDGFTDLITAALDRAELRPELLQVELDVHPGIPSDPVTAVHVDRLQRAGISVTLDGVSPPLPGAELSLPYDSVNLDRRWVRIAESDPHASVVLADLVREAHARPLTVTAVGVETQRQADLLTGWGFDQIQGYHLSEPVPADELGWQSPPDPTGPRVRRSADAARR